jgi:hypothetical protein
LLQVQFYATLTVNRRMDTCYYSGGDDGMRTWQHERFAEQPPHHDLDETILWKLAGNPSPHFEYTTLFPMSVPPGAWRPGNHFPLGHVFGPEDHELVGSVDGSGLYSAPPVILPGWPVPSFPGIGYTPGGAHCLILYATSVYYDTPRYLDCRTLASERQMAVGGALIWFRPTAAPVIPERPLEEE